MKHRLEQRSGVHLSAEAKLCLGLKKQGGCLPPELKVVLEEEHSGKRGSEVINLRALFLELPGVRMQIAEEMVRLCPLTQLFQRCSRVVGHLAESPDAHLL